MRRSALCSLVLPIINFYFLYFFFFIFIIFLFYKLEILNRLAMFLFYF